MHQFVQPLESRQLLSASVSLALDEAKLALDVRAIIADTKSARDPLVNDGKAVLAELKTLKLKTTSLGKALGSAIASGRTKIAADVRKIVAAGTTDGKAIFSDWVKLQFKDGGNATAAATDQTKLAADVSKLWTVEQPFADKIQTDIGSTETSVANAVQAIVNANKSDTTLADDWTVLQGAVSTSQHTISTDFSQLTTDVNQLVADS